MTSVLCSVGVDADPASQDFPLRYIVVQYDVIVVEVGGQSARVGPVAPMLATFEPDASVFVEVPMVTLDPRDDVVSWTHKADWLVKVVDIVSPETRDRISA